MESQQGVVLHLEVGQGVVNNPSLKKSSMLQNVTQNLKLGQILWRNLRNGFGITLRK
jgi:hypothetical protein